MDPAIMLLSTIFIVSVSILAVGSGYAYTVYRRLERRKRKS